LNEIISLLPAKKLNQKEEKRKKKEKVSLLVFMISARIVA